MFLSPPCVGFIHLAYLADVSDLIDMSELSLSVPSSEPSRLLFSASEPCADSGWLTAATSLRHACFCSGKNSYLGGRLFLLVNGVG